EPVCAKKLNVSTQKSRAPACVKPCGPRSGSQFADGETVPMDMRNVFSWLAPGARGGCTVVCVAESDARTQYRTTLPHGCAGTRPAYSFGFAVGVIVTSVNAPPPTEYESCIELITPVT